MAMVDWANELLTEHLGSPPSVGQVKALGRSLLTAADRAQASVRLDGRVDRMDGSHKVCRHAVRSALTGNPVPWGATHEEREQWVASLAAGAAGLLDVAVELVG